MSTIRGPRASERTNDRRRAKKGATGQQEGCQPVAQIASNASAAPGSPLTLFARTLVGRLRNSYEKLRRAISGSRSSSFLSPYHLLGGARHPLLAVTRRKDSRPYIHSFIYLITTSAPGPRFQTRPREATTQGELVRAGWKSLSGCYC